ETRTVLPLTVLPRIVVLFSGLGQGVECPDKFAGPHVEGADVAVCAEGRFLTGKTARDDEVLIDRRRGPYAPGLVFGCDHLSGPQVDHALIAESGNRLAGLGVQRNQPSVERAEDDCGGKALCARPVAYAAHSNRMSAVVGPEFFSGFGIQGDYLAVAGRHIKNAIDDQRNRFRTASTRPARPWRCSVSLRGRRRQKLGGVVDGIGGRGRGRGNGHIELPCDLELRHIAGIDLRQRRVARGGRSVAEAWPVRLLCVGVAEGHARSAQEHANYSGRSIHITSLAVGAPMELNESGPHSGSCPQPALEPTARN